MTVLVQPALAGERAGQLDNDPAPPEKDVPAVPDADSIELSGKEIRRIFASAIRDGLLTTVGMWALSYVLIMGFVNLTGFGLDSTDASSWHRSGMNILTDHATGLEYLKAGDALTPRLDRDGKQMREGE